MVQGPVRSIIVLGGGTAGFLAAIALRVKHPDIPVTLIRSKDIGIIGVGEGTTVAVPKVMHDFMGIDVGEFYREAQPIWKLGIKYLWGPRDVFYFTFGQQMTAAVPEVKRPLGYYYDQSVDCSSIDAALMQHDRAFVRDPKSGYPFVSRCHAYHLENKIFVAYLEKVARARGTTIVDDTVTRVELDPESGYVKALHLESGTSASAELFVDCSGFFSELLGKAFNEPYVSFAPSLFCDRAVVGGWQREPGEVIQPYTVAETMDAGWAWRIDHEHQVNRGYVYSSSFISDEDAQREFTTKNPRVKQTRVVRFRSGRRERAWVKNVVAIGNSHGFVEPLEATAIAAICEACSGLTYALATNGRLITETIRTSYNQYANRYWDAIRRFLSVHYKYNTRLDTEFWRAAREKTDLAGAETIVEFYQQNGPSSVWMQTLVDPVDQFGMEGYLTMFVGQQVPYTPKFTPPPAEAEAIEKIREKNRTAAMLGFSVEQALAIVRQPNWSWTPGFFRD